MAKGGVPRDGDGLTLKQHRFVGAYLANGGNGVEAARSAGYAGSYSVLCAVAHENLRKPQITKAIKDATKDDPAVATREERQRFWTKTMLDPLAQMKDRLRASELLAKSQCDFVQRHEIVSLQKGVNEMTEAELDAEIERERERIKRE